MGFELGALPVCQSLANNLTKGSKPGLWEPWELHACICALLQGEKPKISLVSKRHLLLAKCPMPLVIWMKN